MVATSTAKLSYIGNTRIEIRTRSTHPRLLILNDLYEDGWEATVDETASVIFPVNLIARGIVIPAGEHTVTMRYFPPRFHLGVSLAALFFCLLLLFVLYIRHHAPKKRAL